MGGGSGPFQWVFGPEVFGGKQLKPGNGPFRAGSVSDGHGSCPFQWVFGPEVIGGRDSGEWKRC